jgi:hypothetical protein
LGVGMVSFISIVSQAVCNSSVRLYPYPFPYPRSREREKEEKGNLS